MAIFNGLTAFIPCMGRNMGNQKKNLSFEEYCLRIDELLRLMNRKLEPRAMLQVGTFIL